MWPFSWLFTNNKKPKPMFGIDISHHQSHIDWSAVASDKQNVQFAFIKATEGVNYIDSALKYNSIEAKKAGIKIGYYHFASLNTPNVEMDARTEANHFVDTIKKCPAPDLPLVLDIETNKAGISADMVLLWVKTFFAELEALGYTDYILYSYTPFLDANLPKNHTLGNIRLWIAAYVNLPKPRLPIGWDNWYIWQYSAKGKVSGIRTDCDVNKTKTNIF
jgi:lysozyme